MSLRPRRSSVRTTKPSSKDGDNTMEENSDHRDMNIDQNHVSPTTTKPMASLNRTRKSNTNTGNSISVADVSIVNSNYLSSATNTVHSDTSTPTTSTPSRRSVTRHQTTTTIVNYHTNNTPSSSSIIYDHTSITRDVASTFDQISVLDNGHGNKSNAVTPTKNATPRQTSASAKSIEKSSPITISQTAAPANGSDIQVAPLLSLPPPLLPPNISAETTGSTSANSHTIASAPSTAGTTTSHTTTIAPTTVTQDTAAPKLRSIVQRVSALAKQTSLDDSFHSSKSSRKVERQDSLLDFDNHTPRASRSNSEYGEDGPLPWWKYVTRQVYNNSISEDSPAQTQADHAQRITKFFAMPWYLEKLILLGFVICLDCFLYQLVILPLRAINALLRAAWSIISFRALHPIYQADIIRMILAVFCCTIILSLDASYIYHEIRGQV